MKNHDRDKNDSHQPADDGRSERLERLRSDAASARAAMQGLRETTGGYSWLPSGTSWLPLDLRPSPPGEVPWPGDICLLFSSIDESDSDAPVAPERFVVIRMVDRDDEYASVALLSDEIDMAGGTDVILPPERTGVPYDLMVETDVVGPVRFAQLSQPVGFVDQATIDGIVETELSGVPAVPHARRGLPLRGPDDPRWDFKLSEAEELAFLSGPCVAELVAEADSDEISESELERLLADLPGDGMVWLNLRTGERFVVTPKKVEREGRIRVAEAIEAEATRRSELGQAEYAQLPVPHPNRWDSYADGTGPFSLAAGEGTLHLRPGAAGFTKLASPLRVLALPTEASTRVWVEVAEEHASESLSLTLLVRLGDRLLAVALSRGKRRESATRAPYVPFSCTLPVPLEQFVGADPAIAVGLWPADVDSGE